MAVVSVSRSSEMRLSWHLLQLVDVRSRLSPALSRRKAAAALPTAAPPVARTYALETMGCQMNVADSERMEGQLRALGYQRDPDHASAAFSSSEADLVILNTCSIRDHAEQKVGGLGPPPYLAYYCSFWTRCTRTWASMRSARGRASR